MPIHGRLNGSPGAKYGRRCCNEMPDAVILSYEEASEHVMKMGWLRSYLPLSQ